MGLKEEFGFATKDELLTKLRSYATNPDDDNIRLKKIIRDELLHCPELLYVLNEKSFSEELFDEEGNLLDDGEWDLYFGENSNIRPYIFFPDVQTDSKCYLCYEVSFTETPRYNQVEKLGYVTFVCYVYGSDTIDKSTGIPRHDLIMSIIRERFAWTNHFGIKAKIISDKAMCTDNNYVTRNMVFEVIAPNALVQTKDNKTGYINKTSLRNSL